MADWVEESWGAEGRNNITNSANWLFDAAMKGGGEINVCVRYGATTPVTPEMRDAWGPALEALFNTWFGLLHPYACFPYERVSVRIAGWAVKPGQESLLQWSDGTVPVYTEVSDGSDQALGEPKCPDSCGFFFRENWDHVFADCPGGPENHFDYSLWLNDTGPAGAAAHGSNWGIRMGVTDFMRDIESGNTFVEWHEIGHAFGFSDYYSWAGSTPEGGSVMIVGSGASSPSLGDQWMVRRYFREARELRYPYE